MFSKKTNITLCGGRKARLSLFSLQVRTSSGLEATRLVISIFLFFAIGLSLSQDIDPSQATNGRPSDTAPPTMEPANTRLTDQEESQRVRHIEMRAQRALELISDWSLRFGREIHQTTQEATCHQSVRTQFDPARSDRARRGSYRASVVSVDWTRRHADIVRAVSKAMSWHEDAVQAIVQSSESLAANHTFDENLANLEYVDVHRLRDIDEMLVEEPAEQFEPVSESSGLTVGDDRIEASPPSLPSPSEQIVKFEEEHVVSQRAKRSISSDLNARSEGPEAAQAITPQPLVMQPAGTPMPQDENGGGEWQTPVKYAKLSRHRNFGDTLVNTDLSAVHVPVHIYAGSPEVKNAIVWSEELTRVFKNNFAKNPRLTNQYFASPHGFVRLYPAQRWPVARTDPDLYDARMRPWYVAGASSRKDVVVLVDSSGSMTGSRRDIAKGVVFEILDTLTDNDHFLVLKFNDVVQQVGVPSCPAMRLAKSGPKIPLKNTIFSPQLSSTSSGTQSSIADDQSNSNPQASNERVAIVSGSGEKPAARGTDVESLYLLPANGRNVRYVKTNFTTPTSGIANFSHALVTAFEVLQKYQDSAAKIGSQCNQAIMLITDGSPSDFEDIFNRFNYPNAPVRVFTYLIGRETGDGSHTKMMACHNRGFYTHVINLAEVRETVQQYIPVMARPLVLNGTHPISWTPAYGELTHQMLTDWIWESRRRERARTMLANGGRVGIRVTNDDGGSLTDEELASNGIGDGNDDATGSAYDQVGGSAALEAELSAFDLFGYENEPACFWETRQSDLTTTVVQPVYDQRRESKVVEKYLNKNTWAKRESVVRTANLLGVAAADMKINDIISFAPSHQLGPNGFVVLLTNNGLVMAHPDMRATLEPFTSDPSERNWRILKPFFSSLDLLQVEHISEPTDHSSNSSKPPGGEQQSPMAAQFEAMRNEAVDGKTGWRELITKRTLDCHRRVQTRSQSFYYKPLEQFPFAFVLAIPQPYGSHRLEAQIEVKATELPEQLTNYFTTSDFDLWTVHPKYRYCEGPANNTLATLLDVFQRISAGKLDDISWPASETSKPPIHPPERIVCDKELLQSLVYDALATYPFVENCGPALPGAESFEASLMNLFGVRFSFVATRSGLTRVRHHGLDDQVVKREALAFLRRHARAIDETYYSRTVDYNMLINDTATLLQVPFNTHKKIRERLARFEADYSGSEVSSATSSADLASGAPVSFDGSDESIANSRLSVREMNLFEKLQLLANSSVHVIATEAIIVNEGAQRAVAGVSGVFYDYATFVLRFLNTTNARFGSASPASKRPAECFLTDEQGDGHKSEACGELGTFECGHANDTLDCLLVDNNGYILVSERLEFVGRHLRAYQPSVLSRLVELGVFQEVNVTDHQSICPRAINEGKPNAQQEGAPTSSSSSLTPTCPSALLGSASVSTIVSSLASNALAALVHSFAVLATAGAILAELASGHYVQQSASAVAAPPQSSAINSFQALSAMLPKKSYLRPCDRTLTRYETVPATSNHEPSKPEFYSAPNGCQCPAWFVHERVPRTNLFLLIVDSAPLVECNAKCSERLAAKTSGAGSPLGSGVDQVESDARKGIDDGDDEDDDDDDKDPKRSNIIGQNEAQVCTMFERESKLHKRQLDLCIAHHHEEEQIKLCGGASGLLVKSPIQSLSLILCLFLMSKLVLKSPAISF